MDRTCVHGITTRPEAVPGMVGCPYCEGEAMPEYVARPRWRCWKCGNVFVARNCPDQGIACRRCRHDYLTWENHPLVIARGEA
jgi:DNA-directed RNA polymerase subunit RPC12/RpoP